MRYYSDPSEQLLKAGYKCRVDMRYRALRNYHFEYDAPPPIEEGIGGTVFGALTIAQMIDIINLNEMVDDENKTKFVILENRLGDILDHIDDYLEEALRKLGKEVTKQRWYKNVLFARNVMNDKYNKKINTNVFTEKAKAERIKNRQKDKSVDIADLFRCY